MIQLLDDLRPRSNREVISSKDVENAGLREQLTYFFADWVRVYQHPTSNEKTYASFIMQVRYIINLLISIHYILLKLI